MHRLPTLIMICVLVLGGTGVVSWYLYLAETKQIEADFEQDLNQRASQLENGLIKLRATMRYWRKFYETSKTATEPDQFRSIAKDVLESYPALQLIGWAPVIPKAYRPAFEKQFKQYSPQFSIFTVRPEVNKAKVGVEEVTDIRAFDPRKYFAPAGDQPLYVPMAVIEPQQRAGFLTGLDMSSVNSVKVSTVVSHTRESGSSDIVALPSLPSPFSPRHEPIMVALVPVYQGDASSPLAKRNTLQGFIATIFSLEELVDGSSMGDKPKDIGVQLIDMTGDEGLKVLYRYGTPIRAKMAYERALMDVMGRRWVLVASPSEEYINSRRTLMPILILAGGVVAVGLIIFYSNMLQRQTKLVQTQVDVRTRELRYANDELNDLNDRLEELSRIDSLTEVANRRYFNETLQREWRRAMREKNPLTLLLIDVDFFKRYNDEYGHLHGDECLQQVAKTLSSVFRRGGDLVARYGGEEFAVVLPNTGEEALGVAERCRAAVEALNIAHAKSGVSDRITISVGMSFVVPTERFTPEDLLDSADKGLYAAKEEGRNTVTCQPCAPRHVATNRAS